MFIIYWWIWFVSPRQQIKLSQMTFSILDLAKICRGSDCWYFKTFYLIAWPHDGTLSDLISSIQDTLNRYTDIIKRLLFLITKLSLPKENVTCWWCNHKLWVHHCKSSSKKRDRTEMQEQAKTSLGERVAMDMHSSWWCIFPWWSTCNYDLKCLASCQKWSESCSGTLWWQMFLSYLSAGCIRLQ